MEYHTCHYNLDSIKSRLYKEVILQQFDPTFRSKYRSFMCPINRSVNLPREWHFLPISNNVRRHVSCQRQKLHWPTQRNGPEDVLLVCLFINMHGAHPNSLRYTFDNSSRCTFDNLSQYTFDTSSQYIFYAFATSYGFPKAIQYFGLSVPRCHSGDATMNWIIRNKTKKASTTSWKGYLLGVRTCLYDPA